MELVSEPLRLFQKVRRPELVLQVLQLGRVPQLLELVPPLPEQVPLLSGQVQTLGEQVPSPVPLQPERVPQGVRPLVRVLIAVQREPRAPGFPVEDHRPRVWVRICLRYHQELKPETRKDFGPKFQDIIL